MVRITGEFFLSVFFVINVFGSCARVGGKKCRIDLIYVYIYIITEPVFDWKVIG